ncbi:MAG TPA: hypothetical protein VGW12_21460 [Pyrinomonadaceae bacterium]|nr:hypothetical protein [Pyrinomonadaceae bacterium]
MTDLLVDDHAEVDTLFRDLWPEFDRNDARVVFEKLDYLWARLAVHIRAEHLQLFPALLAASETRRHDEVDDALSPGRVRIALEHLREDHDFFMRELAGAVNTARELAAQDGQPDLERLQQIRGRVSAVADRLVEHNHVEEQQIYLWPDALLAGAELEAVRVGVRREIENLPPRFSEATPR